ncbi:MAG: hypothetical protein LUM44_12250 [Pyrinomonadaceae bacterium]|nr:hypothetical protein [Pyrinomonadaceae bacterium]
MGSWATIYIGDYSIDTEKNTLNSYYLSIFQESDLQITKFDTSKTEEFSKHFIIEEIEEDELSSLEIVKLVCPISIVRDRLNLLGFTKTVSELCFQAGLKIATHSKQEDIKLNSQYTLHANSEFILNRLSNEYEVLKSLTLESWTNALPIVMELKRQSRSNYQHNYEEHSALVNYMFDDMFFGLPLGDYGDYRHLLRLIIDAFSESDELIYDLTDLVFGGWLDIEYLFDNSDEYISPIHDVSHRIIVITEGSTDAIILERSLKLLFPHLANYFRFLDFKGTNIAGGASALAHTVKAFAGVGIVNRIIALFDNDTGAEDALRTLKGINLPLNILVLRYPEIELAKNYPTIGPTGIAQMDVNGLAGSIELYLGDDVLRKSDGSLIPVQWKGYVQSLQKYQGEIISKTDVQNTFWDKIKKCEDDPSLINNYDWSGIKDILNQMFTAFHKIDEDNILRAISETVQSRFD